MSDQMPARDAANALGEVRHRREQVVQAALVPAWYWWVVGLLTVALGIAVDSHRPGALAVAIPAYVLVVVGLTGQMIFGVGRGARLSEHLLGPRAAIAIVGFVWLSVGLGLGLAFVLRALGRPNPATVGCLAVGVALVSGGPALMRLIRRVALAGSEPPE